MYHKTLLWLYGGRGGGRTVVCLFSVVTLRHKGTSREGWLYPTDRSPILGNGRVIKNHVLGRKWKKREKDKVMVKIYSFKNTKLNSIKQIRSSIQNIYGYRIHANVNFHMFEVFHISIFSVNLRLFQLA